MNNEKEENKANEETIELFYIDRQNQRQKRYVRNPELKKCKITVNEIPKKYSITDKQKFFELYKENDSLDYVASYEAIHIQRRNEKEFQKKTLITK